MSVSGIRNASICIYQGDDFACWLTVLNTSDGSPADLTDFTAQAQVRTGPADQSPWQVAAQMVCTICAPSNVSLWIPKEQTKTLTETEYVWDLQLTSSAGQITTILAGDVHVIPEVTRPLRAPSCWDSVLAAQPPILTAQPQRRQLYRMPTGARSGG